MNPGILFAVLLAALSFNVAAEPAAQVEGMQAPAWVERDGRRQPLAPGQSLDAGDRVFTGAGSRALLRLAEGSLVKLGENAEFHIGRLESEPSGAKRLYRGFLDVLKGAFRYTTTKLSRQHGRNIDIRIAAVTAGIRGTDLWGKAAPDKDIVCLIEGAISVQRGNEAPIAMSDPLSFYIAPKDRPALPVAPVDPAQLQQWAVETELAAGEGVLGAGGAFAVHLSSHRSADSAGAAQARFADAGYPAQVAEVTVGGEQWHRTSVVGFRTAADARAFVRRAAGELGAEGAWVGATN